MEGQAVPLSALTTLRIGGIPARLINADTEDDLVDVVREHDLTSGLLRTMKQGSPRSLEPGQWNPVPESEEMPEELLVLGGGSNLVVSDDPFPGLVVRDNRKDFTVHSQGTPGSVTVEATAGLSWDALVAYAVGQEWSGIEALSGIPGTVGAAPVQNIGAYGRELGQNLVYVRVYDRLTGQVHSMSRPDLGLAYRDSVLKRSLVEGSAGNGRRWKNTGRWVVLSVALHLEQNASSAPVRYAELARRLGVEVGDRAPLRDVRDAVIDLRASKGMVLDDDDPDTWSAGSFFMNPVLTKRQADEVLTFKAPRFPVEQSVRKTPRPTGSHSQVVEGLVKTSAAWLIEQAGFEKGFGLTPDAQARLSTKHVLAITNRGEATSEDVVALARAVRDGVEHHFGIRLEVEPVQVGLQV